MEPLRFVVTQPAFQPWTVEDIALGRPRRVRKTDYVNTEPVTLPRKWRFGKDDEFLRPLVPKGTTLTEVKRMLDRHNEQVDEGLIETSSPDEQAVRIDRDAQIVMLVSKLDAENNDLWKRSGPDKGLPKVAAVQQLVAATLGIGDTSFITREYLETHAPNVRRLTPGA